MRSLRWIFPVAILLAMNAHACAQTTKSPYQPLLKKTILAPPTNCNWELVLRNAKFDTSTPAMIYVALYHTDYWTRVAALQVLGTRSSDPDARNALLQVLQGMDGRLSTWAGEILASKGLERDAVNRRMRALVDDGMDAARNRMPDLTRTTITTSCQQAEMERARDRVVNGLWATRVLVMQRDAYGYPFLVAAADVTNQTVYMPTDALFLVIQNYAGAGLPYGTDLIEPLRRLANNQNRMQPMRQMAQQLVNCLQAGLPANKPRE